MKMKSIVAACIITCAVSATAQVKLSFNPEEGVEYAYQAEIVQNIVQAAAGRELPIEETVCLGLQMTVQSKTAELTTAQFIWQDVSYLLSSPMMKMGYDPKKPAENPNPLDKVHEKIWSSVPGKSFILLIAPDGFVTTVKGINAIKSAIRQAVASDEADKSTDLSGSMISEWLGEDAIKGMMEQSFNIYPANNVKAGDSWTVKSNYVISNKSANITTVYTLKDISSDFASIEVASTEEYEPAGGLEGKLKGTQTGILQVDVKTGIPVSSDLMLNIKGDVKQQNMELFMSMMTKIKTTIQKEESSVKLIKTDPEPIWIQPLGLIIQELDVKNENSFHY